MAPTFAASNCFSAAASNCIQPMANTVGITPASPLLDNFFYLDPDDSNLKFALIF